MLLRLVTPPAYLAEHEKANYLSSIAWLKAACLELLSQDDEHSFEKGCLLAYELILVEESIDPTPNALSFMQLANCNAITVTVYNEDFIQGSP